MHAVLHNSEPPGHSRTGVPNLSLTMYPFCIPADEHVPLQHLNRLACTPSAFQQMNTYL